MPVSDECICFFLENALNAHRWGGIIGIGHSSGCWCGRICSITAAMILSDPYFFQGLKCDHTI